jgi:hypothetical protein
MRRNTATTVCAETSAPPDSSDRAATLLNALHETQAERLQKPASSDKRVRDRASTGLSYPEARLGRGMRLLPRAITLFTRVAGCSGRPGALSLHAAVRVTLMWFCHGDHARCAPEANGRSGSEHKENASATEQRAQTGACR